MECVCTIKVLLQLEQLEQLKQLKQIELLNYKYRMIVTCALSSFTRIVILWFQYNSCKSILNTFVFKCEINFYLTITNLRN